MGVQWVNGTDSMNDLVFYSEVHANMGPFPSNLETRLGTALEEPSIWPLALPSALERVSTDEDPFHFSFHVVSFRWGLVFGCCHLIFAWVHLATNAI